MKKCLTCIHNEVCLWLWKFTFKNTTSRIQEREDFDLDRTPHCGHYLESKELEDESSFPVDSLLDNNFF